MECARLEYKIKIKGTLERHLIEWFDNSIIENINSYTLIKGRILDQSELHGLFLKLRDLNLKIISVKIYSNSKERIQ